MERRRKKGRKQERKKKEALQDHVQHQRGNVQRGLRKHEKDHKNLGEDDVGEEVRVERHEKGQNDHQRDGKQDQPQSSVDLKQRERQ